MNLTNKYLVYIDESNILSKTGHSVYVGVFVHFLKKSNITEKIIEIENDLKKYYLHWVDMPWKLRIKFAEKINSLDFICKFIVYDNPINQNKIFEDFLYKIIQSESEYGTLKIIIDGYKSESYEIKLKNLLKNKGVKFFKIKFIDDKKDPLIRLADFMAGMYRSFLDNKNKENIYIYMLLKDKIKISN